MSDIISKLEQLTKLVEMSNESLFSSIFHFYVISDPDHIVGKEVIAELTCTILYFIICFFTEGESSNPMDTWTLQHPRERSSGQSC